MSVILVKLDTNWADEMDIEGFALFEPDAWEEAKEEYKKAFKHEPCQTLYVGTNEYIQYESYEDYMNDLTAIEITDEEAQVIEKYFTQEYSFFYRTRIL